MPDLEADRPDFRMAPPAAVAWAGAAVAIGRTPGELMVVAGIAAFAGIVSARCRRPLPATTLFVFAAVCAVTALRLTSVTAGPVAELADDGAAVRLTMDVVSDPREVGGPHADLVVFDARVTGIEGRGVTAGTRAPVLVFADEGWSDVRLGESVSGSGVLEPPEDSDHAGVLRASSRHRVVGDPSWWWTGAAGLRAAVTESASERSADVSALIPALVHGDDHALPETLEEDFRTSGLTHLLAVSGTNLTLVVGFLLFLARLVGIRGRGQMVLGVLGIVGFVLLARPEPSVVRAAAMGLVALAGLGAGGSRRGTRSLCWAVVGLLLLDPWLARTVGFVLSACATAGILVLAPGWRDRLARWMPRWCAEAVSVPMAAQLACTPVVAAISGQVSIVAVVANLLVAPAVGPATVLGLFGGLIALVCEPAAHAVGWCTGLFAGWIVVVGHHAAALPGAAIAWGAGPAAIAGLVAVCLVIAIGLGWALRRPLVCVPAAVLLAVFLVRPVTLGWPPPDWVMVMCDVGQGDALVLNAGDGQAVVVDTGPRPRLVDGCLSDLGIERVPLVVLTHSHADHAGGLSGVGDDRRVGAIGVSGASGFTRSDVPVVPLRYGERQSVGAVSWTVLGPQPTSTTVSGSDDGSTINNTSVVLLVEVRGVRLLLTGDIEPDAQSALLRSGVDLDVDVLKVPHHGSGSQDPELFERVDATYALISVGADNGYGHPAASMLDLARSTSMSVARTDLRGDLAVVSDDGEASVVAR